MRKIYVIAGHNGKGTGAVGFMDEGEQTIYLRDEVSYYLHINGIAHEKDVNSTKLSGVVAWLKKLVNKRDIAIDIHFNASSDPSATGVECLVSKSGDIEIAMATELCKAIAERLCIRNRGVKGESAGAHSKLAMLSNFECEQLILEVCFVSNKSDVAAYNSKHWLVAKDIANVLIKYAKK